MMEAFDDDDEEDPIGVKNKLNDIALLLMLLCCCVIRLSNIRTDHLLSLSDQLHNYLHEKVMIRNISCYIPKIYNIYS